MIADREPERAGPRPGRTWRRIVGRRHRLRATSDQPSMPSHRRSDHAFDPHSAATWSSPASRAVVRGRLRRGVATRGAGTDATDPAATTARRARRPRPTRRREAGGRGHGGDRGRTVAVSWSWSGSPRTSAPVGHRWVGDGRRGHGARRAARATPPGALLGERDDLAEGRPVAPGHPGGVVVLDLDPAGADLHPHRAGRRRRPRRWPRRDGPPLERAGPARRASPSRR